MLRIIGERGSGKTSAVIAAAKTFAAIVIVPHIDLALLLREDYDYDKIYPYDDLGCLNGKKGRVFNVVLDEVDINFFKNVVVPKYPNIVFNIKAYTFTLYENYEVQVFH